MPGCASARWNNSNAVSSGAAVAAQPATTSASFPIGGYFVQRSGWGGGTTCFEDERFLVFDCGPIGDGGHGHYDALSVDIAARGRSLVVDPGRFVYCDDPPHWRRWSADARARWSA